MLKPTTIPAIQFLQEIVRERKPLAFFLEKWFPRLEKYSQSEGVAELSVKVVKRVKQVYDERAKKYGATATRVLDELDDETRKLVNAWSYHWALREEFIFQQAERRGASREGQNEPNLDETTIDELKDGHTFKSREKGNYSVLVPNNLKDDPLEDLVFVDLCFVDQNAFARKFYERFYGYFKTLLKNSSLPMERLTDDEIVSCVDQVFMQMIRRTFLGLAPLRHWGGRCFINVCKRAINEKKPSGETSLDSEHHEGEGEVRSYEPSIEFDSTDEDRDTIDKYVKLFEERFYALPTALQLALDFRFTRVCAQGQGRPITRIADLSEDELLAAGNVVGLPYEEMTRLFQANKSSMVKLFEFQKRAVEEGLSRRGLLTLVGTIMQVVASNAKQAQL